MYVNVKDICFSTVKFILKKHVWYFLYYTHHYKQIHLQISLDLLLQLRPFPGCPGLLRRLRPLRPQQRPRRRGRIRLNLILQHHEGTAAAAADGHSANHPGL